MSQNNTDANNQIPLFDCAHWTQDPDYINNTSIAVEFCVAEKAIDVTSLALTILICHQMYVYYRHYKVGITAFRMIVYFLAMISSLNTFLHYGIFYANLRSETLFLIVIFEFITFFLICYYYTSKASGLLENKKFIIVLLQVFFVISVSLILIFGTII
jgi:hypothetical protein